MLKSDKIDKHARWFGALSKMKVRPPRVFQPRAAASFTEYLLRARLVDDDEESKLLNYCYRI